jgi:hypothetical protein
MMRVRIFELMALLVAAFFQVSSQAAELAPAREPITFPVKIVGTPVKTAEDVRLESESIVREKDDLVAQQTVADYTRYIWFLSIASTILSALAFGGVVYSLRQTSASIKSEVEFGRLQSRAFMVPVPMAKTSTTFNETGFLEYISLHFTWVNAGNSPARIIEIQRDLQFYDEKDRSISIDATALRPMAPPGDLRSSIVGEGQSTGPGPLKLLRGLLVVFLCRYIDIFGNQHVEHYAQELGLWLKPEAIKPTTTEAILYFENCNVKLSPTS